MDAVQERYVPMEHQEVPRRVVVTGGGRGIGAALVSALAESGDRVVIADLIDDGAQLADELTTAGRDVSFIRTDIGDESSVAALADHCRSALGAVDVLVNNAGIYQSLGAKVPFEEISPDAFRRVLDVNVTGTWLVTRAMLPLLENGSDARIICTASSTVHMGVPYFAHYVASKGAVIALVRALAPELGKKGITINAVAPGLVDTEATRILNGKEYLPTAAQRRAIPRTMVADDLVGAVRFLGGRDSGFITGQTLVVDGGVVFL
ncbi:SDR family NAD(P)-dependent oxidoreductase [Georgenia sp. Z1491]|uniref:SDR family NAD(P)-dependent oxidoreductase n=1 Tax=Georgenia sp. Z1491 TaxID=3416707 RepID=UPI003CEE4642